MFIDKLAMYIESEIDCNVNIGNLDVDGEAALILVGGSYSYRTIDKGKLKDIVFQILVKDDNQFKAYQKCDLIAETLDGLNNLKLGEYHVIKLECTTLPTFVEKDYDKKFLYSALFKVEILGG